VRSPAEAIELAERAKNLTQSRSPEVLGTLAAAHAAAGDFDRATQVAEQAIALATDAGRSESAERLRRELELYRSNRGPWERSPASGADSQPSTP